MVVKTKELRCFVEDMNLNIKEEANLKHLINHMNEEGVTAYKDMIDLKSRVGEDIVPIIEEAIFQYIDLLSCGLVTTRVMYFLLDNMASKKMWYSN